MAAGGGLPQSQPPTTPQNYQYPPIPNNPDYSNFDFSQPIDQKYPNAGTFGDNNYAAYDMNSAQPQTYVGDYTPAAPSTELVRRTRNQQLARSQNGQQEQWDGGATMNAPAYDEDDRELDRRAEIAQSEGQAKRKQIPPFIQKLSR